MNAPAAGHPLTTAPILPTLLRMSAHNLVAMLLTALVSVAETAYVSGLGVSALAGMALVFPLVMLQQMLSAGAMGGGISAAVSRALGQRDTARAALVAWHAVLIALALGLGFTVLFLGWGRAIFSALGGEGEALDQALAYSNVAFSGSVLIWLTNALASVLRGCGDMKTSSRVLLAVSMLQILCGGVLGLGAGPIPSLGMGGVAAGQVIAFGFGTFWLWRAMQGAGRSFAPAWWTRAQWTHLRDILRVGAVASISSLQTVLTIVILTRIVAGFGTEALAGYGIGTRLEFLLVPITFAVGVSCVPMVGMALGAGLIERARRVAWSGAMLSAAAVGALGMLVALFPLAWIGLFTQVPEVTRIAEAYFHWVAPCFGLFAFGLCLYFASQGAGRLTGPVVAGTLRLLIVAVGGYLLLQQGAPVEQLFALIALAMLVYGVATGVSVYLTRWTRG
ncbi:MAG: MATE family efflux transporter [Betaproteobacteria bacterium]|nr:MATE family efflux transporter [Betaproteobacteria bacterium]NBS46939.1 MATE family efflux transporter [Betaproteobacteria bacterium]